MSGWIRIDKALIDSIRFRRVVRLVTERNLLRGVTDTRYEFVTTVVLGALVRLWIYADTHIADNDTLAIKLDEIDELIGIEGFAECLPADWLQVIDPEHVQLPNFMEHNGSSEKLRRDNARRQAEYRHRHAKHNVTHLVTSRNGSNGARPDQTRPDQTRPEEKNCPAGPKRTPPRASVEPDWFRDFKTSYPPRAGDQNWRGALRAANARLAEGHTVAEFLHGARRYAEFITTTGKLKTEYVKQAASFLGPDKHFKQAWDPPVSKPQPQRAKTVAELEAEEAARANI